MKKMTLISVMAVSAILSTTAVQAQRGPRGGWGPGAPYARMYNPQTVETISGEVVKVERVSPMGGMAQGVHLLVRTNASSESISVHLGPSWFLENQEVQIEPKDRVQITGSRVQLEGRTVIIASEVSRNNEVLKLRDESGRPVWAAWRQRGAMGAPGMGPQGMRGGMASKEMAERRQQMRAEHKKMMEEMKAMDARLDEKVAKMNQAQGSAKVDAIADVLNELVNERKTMHERMSTMHERMSTMQQRMMSHMQGMPDDQSGMGATEPSRQTEPEQK